MSKGISIKSGYDDEQVALAKKYMDELADMLEPYLKNVNKKFDRGVKGTDKLRAVQNKLEIATAIKESGIEDEIILDLYRAIKSKAVINRRDHQRVIKKLSDSIMKQSKRKGQKQLNRDQADLEAEMRLLTKIGSNFKLPSSFHLKLY